MDKMIKYKELKAKIHVTFNRYIKSIVIPDQKEENEKKRKKKKRRKIKVKIEQSRKKN